MKIIVAIDIDGEHVKTYGDITRCLQEHFTQPNNHGIPKVGDAYPIRDCEGGNKVGNWEIVGDEW